VYIIQYFVILDFSERVENIQPNLQLNRKYRFEFGSFLVDLLSMNKGLASVQSASPFTQPMQ
jgi:hypothetical protein